MKFALAFFIGTTVGLWMAHNLIDRPGAIKYWMGWSALVAAAALIGVFLHAQ